MTEPHIYFSAQMTTAGIPKRAERVAIYAQGAPKQHEDGSKSIHLNWPMLILSEFAADPAKIAKTVADVLNENAHRFFFDAEQPASLVKAAATLRAAVLRALTEVPEPGWCLNLSGLSLRTGLSRELLRGLVADLRHEGLVEHQRGLWSEDGTPAGAGYALTPAGSAAAGADHV
jgi:hypothetical protein